MFEGSSCLINNDTGVNDDVEDETVKKASALPTAVDEMQVIPVLN